MGSDASAEPEAGRLSQPMFAGLAVLGFLFLAGLFSAVWALDEHFVSRREFAGVNERLVRVIENQERQAATQARIEARLEAAFPDHEMGHARADAR